MGERGPARTPTAELERRGSWRAKTRTGEPQPPPGLPAAPERFTGDERAEWNRLVPVLSAMGVLTVADERALARYCRLAVAWWDAEPGSQSGQAIAASMLRLEQQFGLTPAARAGMAVQQPKREQGGIGAMLKVV